jgi:hypothetical protein
MKSCGGKGRKKTLKREGCHFSLTNGISFFWRYSGWRALYFKYYITQKWERKKKEKEEENNPTSYDLNKMQLRMMERKEAFGMLWGESLGYKNTFHHQSRDMREEDSVS